MGAGQSTSKPSCRRKYLMPNACWCIVHVDTDPERQVGKEKCDRQKLVFKNTQGDQGARRTPNDTAHQGYRRLFETSRALNRHALFVEWLKRELHAFESSWTADCG